MLLNRRGNKRKVSKEIQKYFPPHLVYIEPFFGAGGMFFNKPRARYNLVNDLDSEVYNLFNLLMQNKQELIDYLEILPLHADLKTHWKKNTEQEPVKKAARFLFLSNFLTPVTSDFARDGFKNSKSVTLEGIYKTEEFLKKTNIRFWNEDFKDFINRLDTRFEVADKQAYSYFIYCDPPYVNTSDNYSNSFKEQDFIDLLDCLEKKCGRMVNYAVSEFASDFVIEEVKRRELNIIEIGERYALKKRSTEILITNYDNFQLSLFK